LSLNPADPQSNALSSSFGLECRDGLCQDGVNQKGSTRL
jgi:hypothetical protein